MLTLALILVLFTSGTAFAVLVQGGSWTYGSNNNPMNLGAFSNYYHQYRYHWSSVKRSSDGKDDIDTASADSESRAFINTNLGEHVDFDFGF